MPSFVLPLGFWIPVPQIAQGNDAVFDGQLEIRQVL
jgi:hypothetical protein